MDKLLRRLLSGPHIHLSDERLADLFCRELSFFESRAARRHLAKCVECRMHQRWLEGPRAEHMLQLYRESMDSTDVSLEESPRTAFALWLELRREQEASRQKRTIPASAAWRHPL